VDSVNWSFFLQAAAILISILSLNFGIYKWISSQINKRFSDIKADDVRHRNSVAEKIGGLDDEIGQANARVMGVESRISSVESDVRHLPSHEDVGKIYDRLDAVNGSVQQLIGGQEAMANQVAMLNQHLLDRESPG